MKHFWGGGALGDYRCLCNVVRQLPKSSSWNRGWAWELWVMASTWNQKNPTWTRAKLLILWHHEENQGKCCSQFISVPLQSYPLNVTLNNIPSSKIFCIFNRKMCVFLKARTLNLNGLWRNLCQYLNKTPWIYELHKKTGSRVHTHLMHRGQLGVVVRCRDSTAWTVLADWGLTPREAQHACCCRAKLFVSYPSYWPRQTKSPMLEVSRRKLLLVVDTTTSNAF